MGKLIFSPLVLLIFLVHTAAAQTKNITIPPPVPDQNTADSARQIIERYVAAWRGPAEMELDKKVILALWIKGKKGGEYHVVIDPDGGATLYKGVPERFTLGYETTIDTLRQLDRREINSHTAMGAEKAGDPVPLKPKFPEDLEWTREFERFYRRLHFHFWNRDYPEVIRFGKGTTRKLHGADTTLFYYEPGLRSGWFKLEPGSHVNRDPEDQTNPFSSLFIITRGAVNAQLGGVKLILREGEAVFVPAGMTHEFWTGPDQYAEGILLMFGGKA